MRWFLGLVCLGSILSLTACAESELGECDLESAFELAYTRDGTPAFAGQALINQSCGGGGFCHSEGIAPADRFGVPAGLDFDLNIASSSADLNEEEVARLSRTQVQVFQERRPIFGAVMADTMPPAGGATQVVLASIPSYDRVSDDGAQFTPLPSVATNEGAEILRNWLACKAPVVERTVEQAVGIDNEVGFTIPACNRRCVDPTWPDIVEQIFIPSCGTSRCHDGDAPEADLRLWVSEPRDSAQLADLHSVLVSGTPLGELCSISGASGTPMLVPGDANGSLLVQKVEPSLLPCGGLMPQSGGQLNAQRLCALREWIACGACADPTDGACAACQETARATCGVMLDTDGEPECVEQTVCARFAEGS